LLLLAIPNPCWGGILKKPGETEEKLRKPQLSEPVDVGLHSATEVGYLPCPSAR